MRYEVAPGIGCFSPDGLCMSSSTILSPVGIRKVELRVIFRITVSRSYKRQLHLVNRDAIACRNCWLDHTFVSPPYLHIVTASELRGFGYRAFVKVAL